MTVEPGHSVVVPDVLGPGDPVWGISPVTHRLTTATPELYNYVELLFKLDQTEECVWKCNYSNFMSNSVVTAVSADNRKKNYCVDFAGYSNSITIMIYFSLTFRFVKIQMNEFLSGGKKGVVF